MLESNDQIDITEAYLKDLWIKLLGVDIISTDDDFFALGGSSMQVIEMLLAVSEHCNKQIEFVAFFQNPTIANLIQLLQHEYPTSEPI